MQLIAIITGCSAPCRPVLAKRETLTLAHVHAAFRATFEEDWQLGTIQLRLGMKFFRENTQRCECDRASCPGISAPQAAWAALGNAASELCETAALWRAMEPDWQPPIRSWREWLVWKFAEVWCAEWQRQQREPPADRGQAKQKLDELLGGVAMVAGERRGGPP
jgi:hypothetical protein